MANDPLLSSLALDDIIHSMSPSPAPTEPTTAAATTSSTPFTHSQPPSDAERAYILKRLTEMGQDTSNAGSWEKELVDIVLRLANDTPPDPSQLVLQAEAISSLTIQRDFLIRQAEEQRSRWESESDGWTRSAEALIAQRNKSRNQAMRDGSQERQCSSFESDNKALREKLAGTQIRLTSLESELAKLRPFLTQAFAISPDPPYPTTPYESSVAVTPTPAKQKPSRMRKKKEREPPPVTIIDEQEGTEDEIDELADTPTATASTSANNYSNFFNINNQSKADASHYRSPVKRPKATKGSSISLMSDARAEHLLLAARKIGRERVVKMARFRNPKGKERECERLLEGESFASSPKTPKRPGTNPPPHSHTHCPLPHPHAHTQGQVNNTPHALNPGFVFLNSPLGVPPSFPGSPVRPQYLVPLPGYSSVPPMTPRKSVGEATGTGTNPPTPLDSLLSAARSMMDDGAQSRSNGIGSTSRDGNRKARRASTIDLPESPVPPKRRKVAGGSTRASAGLVRRMQAAVDGGPRSETSGGASDDMANGTGIGRVRSALDVLADQAAVFSSKEQGKIGEGGQQLKGVEADETPLGKTRSRKGSENDKAENEKGKSQEGDVSEHQAQVSTLPQDKPIPVHPPLRGNGPEEATSLNADVDMGIDLIRTVSEDEDEDEERAIRETPSSTVQQSLQQSSPPPIRPDIQPHGDAMDSSVQQPVPPMLVLPALSSRQANQLPYSNLDSDPGRAVTIPLRPDCGEISPDLDKKGDLPLQQRGADTDTELEVELGLGRGTLGVEDSGSKTPMQSLSLGDAVVESGGVSESGSPTRGMTRMGEQEMQMVAPGKRPRSPYVKWTKEEDDLLAQAVAKYGQKWDLVQKALPSRGYHQVRQRWLRKLGVFDNKPDLSSFQTGSLLVNAGGDPQVDPLPNLKLGLAPLSSEIAFSGLGRG